MDLDTRSDSRRVRCRAAQVNRQVVILVDLARMVSVDRRGGIDVIHDEIERATVVEIGVGCPVGKARLRQPPRLCHVGESQIAIVAIGIVRQRNLWHVLEESQTPGGHPLRQRGLDCFVADIVDVIHVVGPAINAVGDVQVLPAVVVEISE